MMLAMVQLTEALRDDIKEPLDQSTKYFQEPVPGISAVPDDVNARYFHVVVAGPEVIFTRTKTNKTL